MKKRIIAGFCILLAIILLFPIPMHLKDGGSVEYRAILYTVKVVHQLNPVADTTQPYREGTIIEFLGIEIFNNVT